MVGHRGAPAGVVLKRSRRVSEAASTSLFVSLDERVDELDDELLLTAREYGGLLEGKL